MTISILPIFNVTGVLLQIGSNNENIFLLCPIINSHLVQMLTYHFHRSLLSYFVSFHEVCCVTEACGYYASDLSERRVVASLMSRITLSKFCKISVMSRINLVKLKKFLSMQIL